MKKTIVIILLAMAVVLLLGHQAVVFLQETLTQQHPTTIKQMGNIAEWVNAANKQFAEIQNNQLFLYRHCVGDPNSI